MTTAVDRQISHTSFPATLEAAALGRRAAELTTRDKWTRRQLIAHQQERLQAILRHAVTASPYYRETIGHLVARDAPPEQFPILSRWQRGPLRWNPEEL